MNIQEFDFSVDILQALLWQYNDATKLQALLQKKQEFLRSFTRVLNQNGGTIATLKTILKFCGIDCGPARSPLCQPDLQEENKLKRDLQNIGFFELILKT